MSERKAFHINLTAPSNMGKTGILEGLENYYAQQGWKVARAKYPMYNPSDYGADDPDQIGARINNYIRKGNPENWDVRTAQLYNAKNKADFDRTIARWLQEKDLIITEDGKWTSIIWGSIMDPNVTEAWLMDINKNLIEPDLRFTLNGPRLGGREANHMFEEKKADLWPVVQRRHIEIARLYGWQIIEYDKKNSELEIKDETERIVQIMAKEIQRRRV